MDGIRKQLTAHAQVVKYLFSGGCAFATEYTIFLLLFYIVMKNQVVYANILSYSSGFIVSFLLNRSWVFKTDQYHHKLHHQVAMYILLGLVNLTLSTIAVKIAVDYLPGYMAKMLTIIAIAAWNFVAYQKILFRKKSA